MGAKVLIVDDEPITVELFSTFMEISGYQPIGALSGADGLALLEIEKPQFVLLDLMMPDMDGFEFCRRMRANEAYAQIPVLIISARTDEEAIKQAYEAGVNGYITKPVTLTRLRSEVERLLQSP